MGIYKEDSLYHIFSEVVKLHYRKMHDLLDDIGLYPGQPAMLYALYKHEGQSQKDLSNKLKIKPATITVMLNRMEKAGLLERKQDKEDQRVSRVYITEKGKEVFSMVKEITKDIDKDYFSNFTIEEQILLRRLLMQMKDNLLKTLEK